MQWYRRRVLLLLLLTVGLPALVLTSRGVLEAIDDASQLVALPELPPIGILHPELFDEDGCWIRIDGSKSCGPRLSLAPKVVGDQAWRNLLGFQGRFFLDRIQEPKVTVLDATVRTTSSGPWNAYGLVRNETLTEIGDVRVTAILYNAQGEELGSASGSTSLGLLRPGEPAPFSLHADVAADGVSQVEWVVSWKDPDRSVSRDLLLQYYWQRPYADVESPYEFAAGFRNLSGRELREAWLVVAWLNDNGRVVWIDEASLSPAMASAPPGSGGVNFDSIVIKDAKLAEQIYGLDYLMWGAGR